MGIGTAASAIKTRLKQRASLVMLAQASPADPSCQTFHRCPVRGNLASPKDPGPGSVSAITASFVGSYAVSGHRSAAAIFPTGAIMCRPSSQSRGGAPPSRRDADAAGWSALGGDLGRLKAEAREDGRACMWARSTVVAEVSR